MKSRILIYSMIVFFTIGCSSDPCDDPVNVDCLTGDVDNDGIINSEDSDPLDPCLPFDNIACPTGDLDNDGIINSLDSAPLDRCLPSVPALELNIIGTWSWSDTRTIEFLDDGTYKDIEGQIISLSEGQEIIGRTWKVDNNILELEVTNSTGQSVLASFVSTAIDCDKMSFERENFDVTLVRI